MPVRKDRSGRWRATLKNGREYVTSKTFDTKREADGWLSREKAALAGGTDPRNPVGKADVVLDATP